MYHGADPLNLDITARNRGSERPCEWPGCHVDADYRAPKSRECLTEYYWFCLQHIRDYNAAWNFYEGMDEAQIEQEIREDTCWQRPTWPMGMRAWHRLDLNKVSEWFSSLGRDGDASGRESRESAVHRSSPEAYAYSVLELEPPVNLTELKARYKQLVKRLHPDVNGGDTEAEDRLKEINQAYALLKVMLTA